MAMRGMRTTRSSKRSAVRAGKSKRTVIMTPIKQYKRGGRG